MDETRNELRLDDLEQVAGGIDDFITRDEARRLPEYRQGLENQIAAIEGMIASGSFSSEQVAEMQAYIRGLQEELLTLG